MAMNITSLQHNSTGLSQCNNVRKRKKNYKNQREWIKPLLFKDRIVHVQTTKESIIDY